MREKWQITKHNRLGATGKALNRKDKLAFNHDLQDVTFRPKKSLQNWGYLNSQPKGRRKFNQVEHPSLIYKRPTTTTRPLYNRPNKPVG